MTNLEIIALIKKRPAGELSAEQVAVIRERLEQHPELYPLVGGRDEVDHYLADAPAPESEPEQTGPPSQADSPQPDSAQPSASDSRRPFALSAIGLLVLVLPLLVGAWLYVDEPSGKEVTETGRLPEKDRTNSTPAADADDPNSWRGWTISAENGGQWTRRHHWHVDDPKQLRTSQIIVSGQGPASLSSELNVQPPEVWLSLRLAKETGAEHTGSIAVYADGQLVTRFDLTWLASEESYFVPLQQFQGRRVKLELVHSPGDNEESIAWHELSLVNQSQVDASSGLVVPRLDQEGTADSVHQRAILTSPYPVFEDEGEFVAVDQDSRGTAMLYREDKYSGAAAVKLTPQGRYRLMLPHKIAIREKPGPLQLRYLCFAFRKQGDGQVCLELDPTRPVNKATRYDAGRGKPVYGAATRCWMQSLPDEWVMIVRDLYRDFGEMDLASLTFSVPDGDSAQWDHVYLARSEKDFGLTATDPKAIATNRKAFEKLAEAVVERGLSATVVIDPEGRIGTGTIIHKDGYVLTGGHLVIGRGEETSVLLSDGREVKAKPLGVFRTNNCGLMKIVEEGPWPSLDLAKDAYLPHESQSIAIAFRREYTKGKKPEVFFVASAPGARNAPGTIWSLNGATELTAGGPLIEDTGRLIGLYSGYNRYGGYVYSTVEPIEANLQRMMGGEVWGEWPEEAGPDVGADITSDAHGCRIMGIRQDSQLAAAGLQPGDYVENIDGQFLPHPHQFFQYLGRKDPGDKVEVEFRKGEEKKKLLVDLRYRQP